MKFLLGTVAYSRHIQNIALALHEANTLGAYYTAGVDSYRNPLLLKGRDLIARKLHPLDRELSRRKITTLPSELIFADWRWEGLRLLSSKLGLSTVIQDWFWEKSEHSLDKKCSQLIQLPQFDVFMGTEHGCLVTLKAAKVLEKKTVVNFLSPHHLAREHWVDSEYQRFPELLTSEDQKLLDLGKTRDARRDEEAATADVIRANSNFTAQSLINAGFDESKIIVVPLAGVSTINQASLPTHIPEQTKFIYAGPVSVRKGAHYLIESWNLIPAKAKAELHFYGIHLLPSQYLDHRSTQIYFHGSVAQPELFAAYQASSILVFPTLLDGFGMVVLEAMAHGLPVITTPNAGAADLIEDGKNGFLVPPKDPKALAERMVWCIEHPTEMLEMRHHALATAQRHTWQHFRADFRQKLGKALDLSLNLPT